MFVIFGWNHQKTKNYGPVFDQKCSNCYHEEFWDLYKISKWVTLFFIPVFSTENKTLIKCPICGNSTQIDYQTFEAYKSVAAINVAYTEDKISNEERIKRIEDFNKLHNQKNEAMRKNYLIDSEDFTLLVQSKSNEELLDIHEKNSNDYDPSFLFAVEKEIKKRRLLK